MAKHISKKMKESLAEEYPCYVLVTCQSFGKDGQMKVEMAYDGDPVLAAYLLQGAQEYLNEQSTPEEILEA